MIVAAIEKHARGEVEAWRAATHQAERGGFSSLRRWRNGRDAYSSISCGTAVGRPPSAPIRLARGPATR
jgi:hypothetical protein